MTTWRPKYEDLSRKHHEVVEGTSRLDQEITVVLGRLQLASGKHDTILRNREPLARERVSYHREQERLAERAAAFDVQIADLEREKVAQQAKRDAYKNEMGSPLARGLSDREVAQTEELGKLVGQLKRSLAVIAKDKYEVGVAVLSHPSHLTGLVVR